jgi:hypothetical protein
MHSHFKLTPLRSNRHDKCVVYLQGADTPSREDDSTSWPSSSGLRGHRRTYRTILESAENALFKMVRQVFLRPLRPELKYNNRSRFQFLPNIVTADNWPVNNCSKNHPHPSSFIARAPTKRSDQRN